VPPCIPESEEPLSEQKRQNLPSSYYLGALESIEDPAEFLFESRLSHFTQLKVGIDTPTFAEGLRRSLRQNLDIIFLGEVRDRDSACQIEVHTIDAPNTMDSIADAFRNSTSPYRTPPLSNPE
jgi:Tfp pilus assembly pilus retraction ATPase PilT